MLTAAPPKKGKAKRMPAAIVGPACLLLLPPDPWSRHRCCRTYQGKAASAEALVNPPNDFRLTRPAAGGDSGMVRHFTTSS